MPVSFLSLEKQFPILMAALAYLRLGNVKNNILARIAVISHKRTLRIDKSYTDFFHDIVISIKYVKRL